MLSFINFWLPWLVFFNDVWVLQIAILYILCLFVITKSNYFMLIYLFLEIIFFGLYIGLAQGELFTGFLWVIEFTLLFIALIFLFYLNVEGSNYQIYLNYFFFIFFLFFCILLKFPYIYIESNVLNLFNTFYLWEDYYESFSNKTMNDFLVLTISYYVINNLELLIFGLLLLVGSIICVILNKNVKTFKNSNFCSSNINFSNTLKILNFVFLRKQNLNKQSIYKPNIRMFKKKQSLNKRPIYISKSIMLKSKQNFFKQLVYKPFYRMFKKKQF